MTTPEEPASGTGQESRVAGGCVLAAALSAAGGVAYTVPEVAYFVTGLLATAAYRRAHGWITVRLSGGYEGGDVTELVNIVAALQKLAADGGHVRLTQLQEATGLPNTRAVRALLDATGIPVRPGVRAGGRNGPGVHHDDVPPLPDAGGGAPSGGCLCSSAANANANNGHPGDDQEGLCVEAIGQAGAVVRVSAEGRAYKV